MSVIVTLGIIQSIIGPKFLNPEVMAEDIRLLSHSYREAPISGVMVYRPTSVFVSAGRFQDLVIVAWLLVFGFSGYLLLRHRRRQILSVFCMISTPWPVLLIASSRGVLLA